MQVTIDVSWEELEAVAKLVKDMRKSAELMASNPQLTEAENKMAAVNTAFMTPGADHMIMYHVDTNCGTELIPEDICGRIDLDAEPTQEAWNSLLQYCEGDRIEGVSRHEGWYGNLIAKGYLDCTPYDGPYDTAQEAIDAVKDSYEVDDNGDDLEDGQ